MTKIKLKPTEILVLRTCNQDMTSYGGFRWPKKGAIVAKDWEPTKECGNGLHGLPWGQGGDYLDMGGIWLVVKVDTSKDYIYGDGRMTDKCKFRTGYVVYAGTREIATQMIYNHAPIGTVVRGLSLTGGYESTLAGGDYSTLTGGDYSTLTGGDYSTLTGGDYSTLTGGDYSTLTWKIWDGSRYRLLTFYVGENGVKANTPYEYRDGNIHEVSV